MKKLKVIFVHLGKTGIIFGLLLSFVSCGFENNKITLVEDIAKGIFSIEDVSAIVFRFDPPGEIDPVVVHRVTNPPDVRAHLELLVHCLTADTYRGIKHRKQ